MCAGLSWATGSLPHVVKVVGGVDWSTQHNLLSSHAFAACVELRGACVLGFLGRGQQRL
jgi:hypothetical protein